MNAGHNRQNLSPSPTISIARQAEPNAANAGGYLRRLPATDERRVYKRTKAADGATNLPLAALLARRKVAPSIYIAES